MKAPYYKKQGVFVLACFNCKIMALLTVAFRGERSFNQNIIMTSIRKISLLFLTCAAFMYSGCKKSETKTAPAATNPIDNKAMATQMAMNLYKSFTGNLGSDNASSGFKTAASFTGRAAAGGINLLCGFEKDTTITFSSSAGGLTTSGNSVISELFNCNGSTVDGYTMADSTITIKNSAVLSETDHVGQHYVVTALNASYQLVSVSGGINVSITSSQNGDNSDIQSKYALSGVEISTADKGQPDVIQGESTFTSFIVIIGPGTGIDGYFGGVTGTIVFQGNFMARVTLNNGLVYMVNMLTGVTTQQ